MLQNYIIELDGRPAGRFFEFAGGGAQADVAIEKQGADKISRKHIASIKYQDMVLACGTGMSHDFYQWIADTFAGSFARKNGAVVQLDGKHTPVGRLEFMSALVTALVLPELDASTKKAAVMTVSIRPEMTRSAAAERSAKPGVYISTLPKAWNISDFRLKIDGLENECRHVTHIDSLKLGQKIVLDAIGESRDYSQEGGALEYSDLVIRLPELFATGFYKWFDDFVVKGNSTFEKRGTLEFFAPSSSKAYFGIEFSGLGIESAKGPSGLRSKTSLPVTVSMYCESMKFYAGPSAII